MWSPLSPSPPLKTITGGVTANIILYDRATTVYYIRVSTTSRDATKPAPWTKIYFVMKPKHEKTNIILITNLLKSITVFTVLNTLRQLMSYGWHMGGREIIFYVGCYDNIYRFPKLDDNTSCTHNNYGYVVNFDLGYARVTRRIESYAKRRPDDWPAAFYVQLLY